MNAPLNLSDREVRALLRPDSAYRAVEGALLCHAQGDFQQPLKPYVRPRGRDGEREGGRYIAMPAFVGGNINVAGIKWIASVPANVDRGLPRASGVVILNAPETGQVISIMECAYLSAARTAAVAAIAFDRLAPRDARRVAMLGAGPIAAATIESLMSKDRAIERVAIYDPRVDRARELAELVAQQGCSAVVSPSAEEAVVQSNVVVAATTGAKGYLKKHWINPGSLLVCLSLDDTDDETFLSSKVVIDDWDQCCREEKLLHRLTQLGKFSRDRVHAQLGELILGTRPARVEADETFLVAPMGMAIEDLAVAKAVFDLARGNTH